MSSSTVSLDHSVGVGGSSAGTAEQAAAEAVRAALGGRRPAADDLVLIFPTIEYDPHELLRAARREAGAARVLGCSAFGWLTGAAQGTAGCSAAYLPAAGLSFGVAVADSLGTDLYAVARETTEAARARAGAGHPHNTLLVLSDGLAGDQREVMRGCYAAAGAAVPVIGGSAGENLTQVVTYQYAEDRVLTNGLVVVWIGSPNPVGVGTAHGWRPVGDTMIVTRASGNVIHELDGRPAAEVYFDKRAAVTGDPSQPGAGERFMAGSVMDGPLGLPTAAGRFDVRHILGPTDDGGLAMFGYVSDHSVVQIMRSEPADLIAAAGTAAAAAAGRLTTPPRGVLVFGCTARAGLLGEPGMRAEAEAITDALAGVPTCGFYTYGEFARTSGSTGFHNASVAVLAL
ncbi:FIST N-terminal domain-containing protein [Actinoplanes sp. NPDC049548]|uniref:FIST signal transduction protein n=1 Tax=Actinoplanes sp. NPDC049548 TaxID=3155152 RepID=UPI0034377AA3